MKYQCCACKREAPFKYSDYKWYIKEYGIEHIREKINSGYEPDQIISFRCKKCEYKLKLIKLPLIYREIEDKYNMQSQIKDIEESLYLFGDAGSGKTFLATMILKKRWENRLVGMFLSYPEFIFSIQTDYENKVELVDDYKTFKGCLVIDDFGAEKMTDFVRQVSYLIINYREQNRLQTVITSNFTLDEIDMYIDRRISSRIAGMCRVVKMSGDKRINKQIKNAKVL